MSDRRLNPAGLLASFFVTSRITSLFVLGCLLFGIVGIAYTPREENPQIVVPGADIIIGLPGASPLEVEQLIIQPMENIVKQISGVDHVFTTAMTSMGIINVQFEVGADKELSLVKLYDQIFGHLTVLPPDATMPMIKSVDVDHVPIVTITLASPHYDDYALKRVADRVMLRLRSIDTVSASYVKGGRDRQLRIEIDPGKTKAHGISFDQVRNAIHAVNISSPAGTTVNHGESIDIFFNGQLTHVDELKRLIVGVHEQQPIYLADIATVVDGPSQTRDTLSRLAFGPADARFSDYPETEMPAVTIAVAKKAGSNAVVMANEVLSRIEIMKQTIIPSNVEVVVTRDDGKKANDAVNLLMLNLGIAVIAVIVITVFFLGWKEALIVGFAVPLILALTLGVDYLFGPTINRVTLFALILSLGMLVDGAIVVVENIHRHFIELGDGDKREATIRATNEIGNPTNLATFAIMLAFASQFVLTGMLGQYFYPLAFNVPVTMLASVLIAYIVTPWAAYKLLDPATLKSGPQLDKQLRLQERLQESLQRARRLGIKIPPLGKGKGLSLANFFEAILIPLLDRRGLRRGLYALIIITILLAVLQSAWQFIRPAGVNGPQSFLGVPVAMLMRDNKNTFNVTITMPKFTPVEITDRVAREVSVVLGANKHITDYQTWIGQSGVIDFNGLLRGASNKRGSHYAEIRVNLTDKKQRGKSSIDIVYDMRPQIEAIERRHPGSLIQLVEDPPGPPMQATVLAEIYGRDLDVMADAAERVKEQFESTYDMVEVYDSVPDDTHEYRVTVDREKAALAGISAAEVATLLRRILDGEEIGRAHLIDEKTPVPITMEIPRHFNVEPTDLSMMYIANRQGDAIPLSELTRLELVSAEKPIFHKDYERVIFVAGELTEISPVYAVLELDNKLDGLEIAGGHRLYTGNLGLTAATPNALDGYQLLWGGELRLLLDVVDGMSNSFGLTMLFIYILLTAYYQSFKIPLIAMSAIPLGIIGIFPAHWILGQAFSATSAIGIIALAGIVVRNSLLIIDFVLDLRKTGVPIRDAILQGTLLRLRPILLTALSTMLGSFVMINDPIFGGLAISLISGTVVSTALTVIVVPLLFYQFLINEEETLQKAQSS
ncbi:MAG: AcrB/AcrD/AcrF family protein [Gammaproteobacteria bacterium]|nr:MAG: AcrB/AcrD/AcrF family protein [Gammaproteobacteria bacterium]RLA52650.1 MAG: AcrB/AcrD/AcrF family protein [Gammaproteobacteria bacterium]